MSDIDFLWHYTDWAGFEGIVRTRTIWASHIQHQNDASEYQRSLDIVREILEQRRTAGTGGPAAAPYIDQMEKIVERLRKDVICTASFSRIEDSLSQWRAYSTKPPGFAIRFNYADLRNVCNRGGLTLGECTYDEDSQRALLERIIDIFVLPNHAIGQSKPPPPESEAFDTGISWRIIAQAPRLKHVKFKEEDEWRFTQRGPKLTVKDLEFRRSGSMIVPYFPIPLEAAGPNRGISRVMVGPGPHQRHAKIAAELLLEKHDVDIHEEVQESEIPYRNW